MTRKKFESEVTGKRIVKIHWDSTGPFGGRADENAVAYIELDDGTMILLSGSPQVEIDTVWAELG